MDLVLLLIRKLDRTEIDCSTVFYYNLGASLLVYMVMFLGAPFIADFYKQPLLTNVTRISLSDNTDRCSMFSS